MIFPLSTFGVCRERINKESISGIYPYLVVPTEPRVICRRRRHFVSSFGPFAYDFLGVFLRAYSGNPKSAGTEHREAVI